MKTVAVSLFSLLFLSLLSGCVTKGELRDVIDSTCAIVCETGKGSKELLDFCECSDKVQEKE